MRTEERRHVRAIVRRVHPDLFAAHPQERAVNSESLKACSQWTLNRMHMSSTTRCTSSQRCACAHPLRADLIRENIWLSWAAGFWLLQDPRHPPQDQGLQLGLHV